MATQLTVFVPAPQRWTAKGLRSYFYPLSKNAKVSLGAFSVWRKDALEWGRYLQYLVREEMARAGFLTSKRYRIALKLLVSDRRRRDPQNFIEIISDFLQEPLGCDDSSFIFETLASEISSTPGFSIKIEGENC